MVNGKRFPKKRPVKTLILRKIVARQQNSFW